MLNHWVVKFEGGFIVYTFGAGVYSVPNIERATVFTDAMKEQCEKAVIWLAEQKGYKDAIWEPVEVHLVSGRPMD